eukprot:1858745-Pyramimonas_sp.AAC.1
MISEILYGMLTYGYWRVETKGIECLVATIDVPAVTVNEGDLISMKPSWAEPPSVCRVSTLLQDLDWSRIGAQGVLGSP